MSAPRVEGTAEPSDFGATTIISAQLEHLRKLLVLRSLHRKLAELRSESERGSPPPEASH